MKRSLLFVVVTAVLALVGVVPVVAGEDDPFPPDTIAVGLGESSTPNVDVTVELSRATFPDGGARTVLIGREDVFADSLASGVLQDEGPLLLVPTDGPVPARTMAEIRRVGATDAVVLGGESAVSSAVAEELAAEGLTVQRLSGPTRIETAIDVARQRPSATTAILARAGGVEGNPSSGFADTLAAGGWAAAEGWPVLLTQTDQLTTSTREYLASSAITTVNIVGGTAAIGQAVEDALRGMGLSVTRVSGADRAATALAIADARGLGQAADVERIILVDGFSEDAWAAGFGAAAQSAGGAVDADSGDREGAPAPLVLGNVDSLPPATVEYLQPGPAAMTCAVTLQVCDAGRVEVGFEPVIVVEVPVGALVYGTAVGDAGQVRAASFDGTDLGFVYTCPQGECGEMDWFREGDLMALHETGTAVSYFVVDAGRPILADRRQNDQVRDVVELSSATDRRVIYHQRSTQCTGTPLQAGGGCNGGVNALDRVISTLQAAGPHAGAPDAAELSTALYRTADGRMVLLTIRSFDGFDNADAQVQIRPGAALIGAALDPAGSGDIAIVDAVAGVGVLRIAPWPDGEVVQPELVAVSDPHWLPDGETVVLVAEDGGTTQLVAVDAATGEVEVLVDDAGPDVAERVEADASGTLIAWRTGNTIRVLNTTTGDVATVTPPAGQTITGGPSFRPSR